MCIRDRFKPRWAHAENQFPTAKRKAEEVRQQLVFLLQLQQSDVKVRELESAVKQLPAKLDPLSKDLAKLQGMLDGERAKLAETDSWRKSQQEMIDRERDSLKAAQSKLQA